MLATLVPVDGVVEQALGNKLIDCHLGQALLVEALELLGILLACLLELSVEGFALALIVEIIDLLVADFGHHGVVAEEVAAVGDRIAEDKREQGHENHYQ